MTGTQGTMRKRTLSGRLAAGAALVVLLAGSASAQEHSGAVGYGAGGVWFSPFNRGAGGSTLDLGPGWVLSGHLDQWLGGGRLGGRLGGTYSQRPLDGAGERRDINVWTATASAMLRVLPPRPGGRWSPFVAAGAGLVSYGLGRGIPVVVPEAATVYPGGGERQLAGVVGVGLDLFPRLAWHEVPLGVRVELADHMTRESPFERLGGGAYGPVHNVTLTVGIHGLR